MLRAGLAASPWVSVDDTSARHQARGGFCTHIGNDWFPWFGTRECKSRLNFLDLLRGGEASLVLTDAAFDDMRRRALPAALIARLAEQLQTTFADQAAWSAHLERLGFTDLKTTPNPVQIATEGAIWGSIHAQGLWRDAVVRRRCRAICRWPSRAMLGARGTAGAQARSFHGSPSRRAAAHSRSDLGFLCRSQVVSSQPRPTPPVGFANRMTLAVSAITLSQPSPSELAG
ncbi:MAG: hypothetical protein JO270_12715 [Acidobacteriaceae bacterium]|nr:hypothetical protein [Acidobacteriaceae bacterium]